MTLRKRLSDFVRIQKAINQVMMTGATTDDIVERLKRYYEFRMKKPYYIWEDEFVGNFPDKWKNNE